MELRYLLVFLVSLVITAIGLPFFIKIAYRLKVGQNILHYVETHKVKQGTPTMGGVVFVVAIIVSSICFFKGDATVAIVTLSATFGYFLLGFFDDFIKVKTHKNLGLRAWQKLLGQILISLAVSYFAYKSVVVDANVLIPFTDIVVNFGYWIIPFSIFIFLATTNSVNLTDGLDGLAANVSKVVVCTFGILIAYLAVKLDLGTEFSNLAVVCFAAVGALIGFGLFNNNPAKIFMGDSGSLALGALVASIALFSRLSLFIPIFGLMFVLSTLSVIIQVTYFKLTKGKRVFLMSPLHHHFEKKGMHENRVATLYVAITTVLCAIGAFVQIYATLTI